MSFYFEYFLYASICFFPFMIFAYYPLRYFKRFSIEITILLELIASMIEIIFFVFAFPHFERYPILFIVIIVIFNPLAYMLIYKVNIGRILFNLLMIVNYANFTVFFAKLLELVMFPEMAQQNFHWTNSLCIFITELVFIVPVAVLTKRFSDDMIKDNSFDFLWNFAWILPLAFSMLGFIIFYKSEQGIVPGMNYYWNSSIFFALISICQMMIYYYIAKIIRQQQAVHKLERDIYHHSLQKVMFNRIEEQIKDTRILRHDMRHHITLMCHYVETQEYDKLKEYLYQYSYSIDQIAQLHYTDHSVLNALLVYYADLCRSKGIMFDVKLFCPSIFPVNESEVTSIFGNLLENAYHACSEMKEDQSRSIRFHASLKAHNYLFIIDNTFENSLKKDKEGNYLTTKEHGSGVGILSVKEIIENHNGYIKIAVKDNRFEVCLSIPEKL